ncbi:MAG: hypothetical protein AAF919_16005 [Pseudomonadota bacterium]
MLPALATLDLMRQTLSVPVFRNRPTLPGITRLPSGYETALLPDLPRGDAPTDVPE